MAAEVVSAATWLEAKNLNTNLQKKSQIATPLPSLCEPIGPLTKRGHGSSKHESHVYTPAFPTYLSYNTCSQ